MSYKIALTSSNGADIDQHFGHTSRFAIVQVEENSGGWELLEYRDLRPVDAACPDAGSACGGCGSGHGHQDGRLQAVVETLAGCVYILTAKIGPKPQAVLKQAGITALESPADLSRAVAQLNAYHQRAAKRPGLRPAAAPV